MRRHRGLHGPPGQLVAEPERTAVGHQEPGGEQLVERRRIATPPALETSCGSTCQVSSAARSRAARAGSREPCGAGQYGVPGGRRHLGAGLAEHLDEEERVATGQLVQLGGGVRRALGQAAYAGRRSAVAGRCAGCTAGRRALRAPSAAGRWGPSRRRGRSRPAGPAGRAPGDRGTAAGRGSPRRPTARPRRRGRRGPGRRAASAGRCRRAARGAPRSRTASSSGPPTSRAMSRRGASGRGVKRPSQAPQAQVASGSRRWSSSTSEDLPTPASPEISTRRPSRRHGLGGVLEQRPELRLPLEQGHDLILPRCAGAVHVIATGSRSARRARCEIRVVGAARTGSVRSAQAWRVSRPVSTSYRKPPTATRSGISGWDRTRWTSSARAASWSSTTWNGCQLGVDAGRGGRRARGAPPRCWTAIAQRVWGMTRIRSTPSRWTPRTSASSACGRHPAAGVAEDLRVAVAADRASPAARCGSPCRSRWPRRRARRRRSRRRRSARRTSRWRRAGRRTRRRHSRVDPRTRG